MNSQNKQQAIKAAYGEFWENVRLSIDDNGWFDMAYSEQVPNFDRLWDTSDKKNAKIRPKSLSGIETNNSWTRIESEEDLPKEYDVDYFCFHKNGRLTIRSFYEYLGWGEFEAEILDQSDITHYQPVQVPKPPIF